MKRNIFSAMCLTAVVLLSASCSQDNEEIVPATNERVTFTGIAESLGGGTRAYNEYSYIVKWNENDQIYVTDNDGHNNTFTLASGKDTPVGTFSEDEMEGGTYAGFLSGKTIEAFYPASLKTADGYVWPATQSNNQVAPMYAKQSITGTANEVVNFSSLGAMLQIVFSTKTEGITVTSITLQSNKKPLSGKFTVTDGQAIMAENSENPGVTLNLGESGVPVGVAATYFYLAIPAGTYSTPEKDEVMTITFKDDVHGKECVMTSTTFPTVNRNTVGRITLAKDFTDLPFVINGHAYVELARYKWATENVGYCKDVTAVAGPNTDGNELGFYFYKQEDDDALNAAQSWGSESGHQWTLPSESQWNALITNCYWEWTPSYNYPTSPYNGMSGYIVYQAKSDADKNQLNKNTGDYAPATDTHLFLPAAGICYGGGNDVNDQGNLGCYWSTDNERSLYFYFGNRYMFNYFNPNDGLAVRPVSE